MAVHYKVITSIKHTLGNSQGLKLAATLMLCLCRNIIVADSRVGEAFLSADLQSAGENKGGNNPSPPLTLTTRIYKSWLQGWLKHSQCCIHATLPEKGLGKLNPPPPLSSPSDQGAFWDLLRDVNPLEGDIWET